MKRLVSIAVASLALSLLALGGIASCLQGEGERCQIQSDCEAGLVCNVGEGVCRRETAARPIDASPPPDAPPDAPQPDALDAM